MDISQQDHECIAKAIHSAEAKTSAEIVCVLAKTSSHNTAMPILIAVISAFAAAWLFMAFTAMTVQRILSLQFVVFLLLLLLLSLPRVRVTLLPRKTRRAIAHHAALEQFINRGIGRHKTCRGILIFVSLAERYARIIADDEIARRVPSSEWQMAVDALVAHMRDGRIADGFVAAIEKCGKELARHFPPTEGNRDWLPNRIYLI
jgi:putative membrane protein